MAEAEVEEKQDITPEEEGMPEEGSVEFAEGKRKGPGALGKFKKSYMNALSRKKAVKVIPPKGARTEEREAIKGITTIPKIVEKHIQEIPEGLLFLLIYLFCLENLAQQKNRDLDVQDFLTR